jgi:hypothetical protein
MKIFWSWQSDTPGKIGRHFVRDVLAEAIKILKETDNIVEPAERDTRNKLHLDHDRQGVPGSPDLAPTIFGKINNSSVFIADVTLVAATCSVEADDETGRTRKFINANVAIEFGYALKALGDEFILMIQNVHYGDRDELPFDLKHKAGPIQYRLAPGSDKARISLEFGRLRGTLVDALRPYLARMRASGDAPRKFKEIPTTGNIAFFWQPADILASRRSGLAHVDADDGAIDYRYNEPRTFFLRLIPTRPITDALTLVKLMEIVEHHRLRVFTSDRNYGMPGRNQFGAIIYETHGNSKTPTAFTQLFRNGEIWGVSRELITKYGGKLVIPMQRVEQTLTQVLANFVHVAHEDLGVAPPYEIEIGAVGLKGVCVSLPKSKGRWSNDISEPIYDDQIQFRRFINDTRDDSRQQLVQEFCKKLYDLAAIAG